MIRQPAVAIAAIGASASKDFCNIIVPAMPTSINLQNVLVLANPSLPDAAENAAQVAQHFQAQGIVSAYGLLYDEALRQKVNAGKVDLLVALGGDGTMLRAGHLCAPNNVPILGINMGRFGFLTEIQ